MRFVDLHDVSLPLGCLTVWQATDSTQWAAAEQPTDPRGPSRNQQGHIVNALTRRVDPDLVDQVADPSGEPPKAAPTGWLGVSFDVPHLDGYDIRRAFETWIARHETLRSGFRPVGFGADATFERFTLEAGDVRLEPVDHGTFTDVHVLADALDDIFNRATDAIRWPSYALCSIRSTRSTTLILAFDHINIDGYSILLAVSEIRELLEAAHEGRPDELRPVPSYVDFAQDELALANTATITHEAIDVWRTFLGPTPTLPVFPLADGLAPGSQVPQRTACIPILTEGEADAFGTWCRANAASSATGFIGALTLAFGRKARASGSGGPDIDGPEPTDFRALVSTHTRHAACWAEALGWFTAIAPLAVTFDPDREFADVLPVIADGWATAKRGAALPMARVAELLELSLQPRFVVSYLDTRHARSARRWQNWNARAYLGDVGPTDEVYVWINRVPGETYLTWRFPGNDICTAQIEAVTAAMREIILDAIAGDVETTAIQGEKQSTWL
ncbi:MAG: hypothetical protein JST73_05955 [Actinobacteria bacterium]|nr:hypothetical protein [Actinomycetota bacterium]